MDEFVRVGVFFLLVLVFPLLALLPAWKLQPRQPTREKCTPYECGVDSLGKNTMQYPIGYFLYALLFLLFDVETAFLYPWAVKFKTMGLFSLLEMFIFVGILAMGLGYAWRKGALSWKS